MGRGLALALRGEGLDVAVLGRDRRPEDTSRAALVLIATPDDVIEPVALELGRYRSVGEAAVVLHLSGLLDRAALRPLDVTGAALGSFHPLQSIADPSSAPERLRGAFAGLEGDPRALAAGERLAAALGMRAILLPPGAKPAYHAGAVIASNYTVVLAAVAERVARLAGLPPSEAAALYLPLMQGTVANLAAGPAGALTGPVRRGDVATLRRHLAALEPDDRVLYRTLGLGALRLAREAGLGEQAALAVERVLTDVG